VCVTTALNHSFARVYACPQETERCAALTKELEKARGRADTAFSEAKDNVVMLDALQVQCVTRCASCFYAALCYWFLPGPVVTAAASTRVPSISVESWRGHCWLGFCFVFRGLFLPRCPVPAVLCCLCVRRAKSMMLEALPQHCSDKRRWQRSSWSRHWYVGDAPPTLPVRHRQPLLTPA
jgi:hypothetical protein